MTVVEENEVRTWLASYGTAWEARDPAAFVRLFAPDLRYHWTPFEAPKEGREALVHAFTAATARQEGISFQATVLSVRGAQGVAHWRCSFVRPGSTLTVRLDGIFVMEFDGHGACTLFREWWHSDEAPPPPPLA
jgi:ketosteroid isomerase-like protein